MSNIITNTYILNITPGAVPTVVYLNQNENGRILRFQLASEESFEIPSGSVATFEGTKPDGKIISSTCTLSTVNKEIAVQESVQMTAVAGTYNASIKIINGSYTLATGLIKMVVGKGTAFADMNSSSVLNGLVAEAEQYAETYRQLEARVDNLAHLTDGSTTGDAELIDGRIGVDGTHYSSIGNAIRAQAMVVDDTLTQEGKAADAKVVGEYCKLLSNLSEETGNLFALPSFTKNGLTVTELDGEVYQVNGTATAGVYANFDGGGISFPVPAGTYSFVISYLDPTKTLDSGCGFAYGTNASSVTASIASGSTKTFSSTTYIFLRLGNNGSVYNNLKFRAMVGRGTGTKYLPHNTAIDYTARHALSEEIAMASRSSVATSYIAWDYDSKTISVKGGTFVVGKNGIETALREQTVDISDVETTYDAYKILLDSSGYISAKAWNAEGDSNTHCIGLIYGRNCKIFGVDNVMTSRQVVHCFGDSITAGANASKLWHQILGEQCNVICRNWGVGGTGYSTTVSGNAPVGGGVIGDGSSQSQFGNNDVLHIMNGKTFNSCVIFAGTNDYGTSKAIDVFTTAVRAVLDKALEQTNNILVITPIKRYYDGDNRPYTQPNSAGHTLKDYADVIKAECESRGIGCFDGFDICLDPLKPNVKTRLMPDGLHPNDEGHKRIAGAIRSAFEENCAVL